MPDISDEPDRLEWIEGTPLALLVGRSEQEPSDSRCLLALYASVPYKGLYLYMPQFEYRRLFQAHWSKMGFYRVDQKKCMTFTKCRLHLLANPTTHVKVVHFFWSTLYIRQVWKWQFSSDHWWGPRIVASYHIWPWKMLFLDFWQG